MGEAANERTGLRALLFPEPERSLPGERQLRTLFRTAHIAAMAVLLGGHAFDVAPERLHLPLAFTVGTGGLLVLLELYGSFNWLFQVRGLASLVKIALVCLVPVFWDQRMILLMVVLVIGSLTSHMQARYRYYSILTGRMAMHKKG